MRTRVPAGLFLCAGLLALQACSGGETPTAPTAPTAPAGNVPVAAAPAPPPAPVPATPTASAIVEITNIERERAGLGALRAEARLTQAAQLQAEQNARLGRLEHVLPDAEYPRPEDRLAAAGYRWQAYGENIAFGYPDAASVMAGWMASPGHRDNILGTSFSEVGVGHARDASGRPYYAQVFGRPR